MATTRKTVGRKTLRNETSTRPSSVGNKAFAGFTALRLATSDLQALIDALTTVRVKLAGVDRVSLDEAGKASLNQQIDATDEASTALKNVQLEALTEAFAQALPGLRSATTAVAGDLGGLTQAIDVINRVSSVLAVMQKIVDLIK